MKVLDGITQGSPEWLAARTQYFTASEAPAMMGASKYQTRSELLHQKFTGLTPDVDRNKQALFDRGHASEAAARTILEEFTGEEFFPITAVDDTGKLLASVDGITMGDDVLFEHKLWSESLAAQVRAGDLEPHYTWQLEQQLLVTGAKKVIFVCSDGTRENWVQMEYLPVPGRAENLVAAWNQFSIDLAVYELPAAAAAAPTGRTPDTLPALFITVKGEVTASNLAEFKETALTAIRSVNRELTTDQDFADAEKAVKWCEEVESRLKASKEHALSQTASIDQLFKVMDEINAEARATRLDLDKLVKARKLSLKSELLIGAQTALGDFLRTKNAKLGRDYIPQIPVDFAGAIHGKKSFDSMRSALNAALANSKIEANRICDKIEANLTMLREKGKDHGFLFNDVSQLVTMETDHLDMLVDKRISDHAAEQKRKEEETRERIRAEEVAKLAREAEAAKRKADAEQAEAARVAAAAELKAAQASPEGAELSPAAQALNEAEGAKRFAATHPAAANVVPMPTPQESAARILAARLPDRPSAPPTLSLGQIGTRLGFSPTAAFLSTLGFEGERVKGAVLFHEHQFTEICDALDEHIVGVRGKYRVTEAA